MRYENFNEPSLLIAFASWNSKIFSISLHKFRNCAKWFFPLNLRTHQYHTIHFKSLVNYLSTFLRHSIFLLLLSDIQDAYFSTLLTLQLINQLSCEKVNDFDLVILLLVFLFLHSSCCLILIIALNNSSLLAFYACYQENAFFEYNY